MDQIQVLINTCERLVLYMDTFMYGTTRLLTENIIKDLQSYKHRILNQEQLKLANFGENKVRQSCINDSKKQKLETPLKSNTPKEVPNNKHSGKDNLQDITNEGVNENPEKYVSNNNISEILNLNQTPPKSEKNIRNAFDFLMGTRLRKRKAIM